MKPLISLFSLFLLLTFSLSTAYAFQDVSESDRLTEWLDAEYEEQLQFSPINLTLQGSKEKYGEIDDVTIDGERGVLDWMASSVKEMKESFNYNELNDIAKMSYDLWVYQYETAKETFEFTQNNYVFHQMNGVHGQLPNFLINFHQVENAADMSDYIMRVEGIGQAIEQLIVRAKKQAEDGIRPPRFAYEIVSKQSNALITGVPFNNSEEPSPIWSDATTKISTLQQTEAINADQAEDFREQVRNAMINHFAPAYRELIDWLEEDIEYSEEAPVGVSRHTNGDDYYRYRLKLSTTTDMTADEIHNVGLAEVDRIHSQMIEIKNEVGFEGSLNDFFQFTNEDEQFFFDDTDEGREAYLEAAREHLEDIESKLPHYFGILPKAGLIVKRVEAFREQDGAPQHYFPGTPDGKRPGIFYAHLSDMKSMPIPPLEAIAYHEGNPGHHMQLSIAQELTDIPKFRTQYYQTAYVEGWALYSELLSKEMGQYDNPYSDFGRLTTELWRAIRLVVDTGLHANGWTEEQAFNYFRGNSPIAEGAIRAEVRRYMVIPGQATAYKIGMIKILELREIARNELEDMFDISEFHDVILGNGSLPLPLLEKRVNQWIAEKGS